MEDIEKDIRTARQIKQKSDMDISDVKSFEEKAAKEKDIRKARYYQQAEQKFQAQAREEVLSSIKKQGVAYTEVKNPDGTTSLKAEPKTYYYKTDDAKSGARREASEYIPHEIVLDAQGNIVKEIERQDYQSYYKDKPKYGYTSKREVYEAVVKEYKDNQPVKQKVYDQYSSFVKELGEGRSQDKKGIYLKEEYDYEKGEKKIMSSPEEEYREMKQPIPKAEPKQPQFFISPEGKVVGISKKAESKEVMKLISAGYVPRERQEYASYESPYKTPLSKEEKRIIDEVHKNLMAKEKPSEKSARIAEEQQKAIEAVQERQRALGITTEPVIVKKPYEYLVVGEKGARFYSQRMTVEAPYGKAGKPIKVYPEFSEKLAGITYPENVYIDVSKPVIQEFAGDKSISAVYIDGQKVAREDIFEKTPSGLVSAYTPTGPVEAASYKIKTYSVTRKGEISSILLTGGLLFFKYPVGFVEGAKAVLFHLPSTTKDTIKMFVNAHKESVDLAGQLTTDPTELGRVAGQFRGAGWASKVYIKSGKFIGRVALTKLAKTELAGKLPKSWFVTKSVVTRAKGAKGMPAQVEYAEYQKVRRIGDIFEQAGEREAVIKAETVERVASARVKGYWRKIKQLEIGRVSEPYGELKHGERIAYAEGRGVYVEKYIKPKIRYYNVEPTPFDIEGTALLKQTIKGAGKQFSAIRKAKVKFNIDPTKFKIDVADGIAALKQKASRIIAERNIFKGISSVERGIFGDLGITKIYNLRKGLINPLVGMNLPPLYEEFQVISKVKTPVLVKYPEPVVSLPVLDVMGISAGKQRLLQQKSISEWIEPISSQELILETELKREVSPELAVDITSAGKLKSSLMVKPKLMEELMQEQKPNLMQELAQSTNIIRIQKPDLKYDYKQKIEEIPQPVKPTPIPLIIGFEEKLKPVLETAGGYDVFSRIKGKMVRLNKRPLTEQSALSMGAKYVDETPAVTFIVKKSQSNENPESTMSRYWDDFNYKFRSLSKKTGQRKTGMWIEKEKYRLDMPVEKAEVTLKGLDIMNIPKIRI